MARLLSVHAHPDDEASKGAPTVRKIVDQGHEAYLVCATGGELGDILNPAVDTAYVKENLTEVRRLELEASVEIIGYSKLIWLGYRDSGMADEDGNPEPDPTNFANADLDEAAGRLVAIIRSLRPHVIITYADDQQGYRHPDHLKVHDVSALAFERAGDPEWYSDAGTPWQPSKLYYSLWSSARNVAYDSAFKALDLKSPYGDNLSKRRSIDHRITTMIDITGYYQIRSQALLAHKTQVDPDEKFWFGLPDEIAEGAYPFDDYILAKSHVESEVVEGDLFAGIQEGAGQ